MPDATEAAPRPAPALARLRLAPGFSEDQVLEAIERHRRCLEGGGEGQVLKNEGPARVTRVLLDGQRAVCVKEYGWRGSFKRLQDLVRPAPALREWRAGLALARRGVAVATPLALAEARLARHASSAYLVQEALDGERLDFYVLRRLAPGRPAHARKRRFVGAVADELRRLHDAGIRHGDTKAANLLVLEQPDGWALRLIELANVKLGPPVPYARRVLSLAQLNASVPRVVSVSDRLRFLLRYARGLPGFDVRRAWRDVVRITRQRKCVWDRPGGVPAGFEPEA